MTSIVSDHEVMYSGHMAQLKETSMYCPLQETVSSWSIVMYSGYLAPPRETLLNYPFQETVPQLVYWLVLPRSSLWMVRKTILNININQCFSIFYHFQ